MNQCVVCFADLSVAVVEAGKAVLRGTFGGWLGACAVEVTTKEVISIYLVMTCHYRAEGSVVDTNVPDYCSTRCMSLVHEL